MNDASVDWSYHLIGSYKVETHPDMLSSTTVTHNFVSSQFHFLVIIKFKGIIVYVSFYLWKE